MARKKREPGGRGPKRRHQKPPLEKLPDRRVLEGAMRQFMLAQRGEANPDTPLDQAQALMYRAFEEPDEQRRVQLAKEALQTCPDCADAYVLLAEHARNREEALGLYQQGTAAGERALGPQPFRTGVGRFWDLLDTRPYMRARLGLVAHALWTAGRREEAVQHLQDMLRLNPGDNQGVRYTLAGFLLFLDRDDDLARLLQQYPDDGSAAWAYTKALLAFRRLGDTPEARPLLKQARKTNRHVPAYLLGEKFPPSEQPGSYSPGDESEALNYVGSFLAGWKSTPGAVAWLRENIKEPKEGPHAKGPLGFIKKWLTKNLPQEYDVWQADFRQMPNWMRVAGKPVRPWVVLVTSRSNDLVLGHEMPEDSPSAAVLWDALVQALQHPAAGTPHRPTELQVRPDECWEALRPHLDEIGVGLDVAEELEQMEVVFNAMCAHVCGKPQPGLLDMPGVTPAQVGSFYEAAAFFFRQAPWKKVGYEAAIKVECAKFQSGPWFAVLMGQSGLTMGLALYEDVKVLRRLWAGERGDEDSARQSVATTVTFGEEWDIPVADREAARRYGWQVARPDAYPEVFHQERGLALRPPLDVDVFLCESVCLEVGRRAPDRVLVLPPIAYGLNLHHIDFPGTIHIEPETFIAFCLNITKSVAYHGFKKILLVNGHGSNAPLIDLVARKTVLATESLCFATGYYLFLMTAFGAVRETQVIAHADEFETSLYLQLAPERVQMDKAVEDNDRMGKYVSSDSTGNYPVRFNDYWGRWTKTGVHGDPTKATAEKGRVLFEAAVNGLLELVDELRAWPVEKRQEMHAQPVQAGVRW